MERDGRVLDLKGLASVTNAAVTTMLAELEGVCAGEGAPQDSFWTRQFAASSKPGKVET